LLIKKYTFYRLRDAVRRNFPEKWGTKVGFPFTNSSAHQMVFSQEFLRREHCENTGTSPYCHDVAAVDFYLFPRLISTFKGRCFCDATDVIKNVMEELRRLSQHDFQECFQHLYSRWQKCLIAQGEYFEGNVA
jgi:hypothetical protein